ncbi:MAG: two-component system, NtrC family, response regulator HydG [Blastocatellia bacterium]|jgi:pSer/pThr/pTyr-binding forkhead associated (FHA) protein|nr:two-component system, NtrC family, response regulator HydG [Blastocatellia bacterium]
MITNKTGDSTIKKMFLASTPRLVAVNGPLSGHTFYPDEPVSSIGRIGSNDICLDDPFVSRNHCAIRNDGDEYLIEDLHSANGTYLDGERIDTGSLKEECLITIGISQFLFKLQGREESITLGQKLVVAENGRSPLDELRSA